MQYVDLRSDTVTKPSPAMREAIARAEVGDDVWGDDPTVNALQQQVADMLGKEAALFVTSGSMGNTLAILSHTTPGTEAIVEYESHTFFYECGAASALGGVQLHPLRGNHGILEPQQIAAAVRPDNVHIPPTRLIVLENTHNRGGGTIYPIDKMKAIRQIALENKINMHMDGARLFNAVVASGIPAKEYAQYFDSVTFCFSKGLGAPVGSILVGTREFIKRAHRLRKMLGGGMRQAGILAAAAQFALAHNVNRLAEDHKHAKMLARTLADIPAFTIDADAVQTNILVFDVSKSGYTAQTVVDMLAQKGVLMATFGEYTVRAVTHLDVSQEQIKQAITVISDTFK
ncbi:low-specificity L-threonine aldolase [candidate division KSB1 bacterium]|nr:low-specificity L-threonine aldolase [candidate division KSB1 bacterium]